MIHGDLGNLDTLWFIFTSLIFTIITWALWKYAFEETIFGLGLQYFCMILGIAFTIACFVTLITDIIRDSELGVILSNASGIILSGIFFKHYLKKTKSGH